jgi:cephalosporin hydroxylase
VKKLRAYFRLLSWSLSNRKSAFNGMKMAGYVKRALDYTSHWNNKANGSAAKITLSDNPIKKYFDAYTDGNGIWKWNHYFDIYHRHFEKFRGEEVHIVEIGVYSGGSMNMWRSYFGDKCKVYGVDIQKECLAYRNENVEIFIGDQEDRDFWKEFRSKVPRIDIVVDDGGHTVEQQIVTLEELLPGISAGGVYLCEDIHGSTNCFADYVNGLQKSMNYNEAIPGENYTSRSSSFQKNIHSIHIYPYAVVIEKNEVDVPKLFAPKHGTIWEPFL